jgi:hypothetical protein
VKKGFAVFSGPGFAKDLLDESLETFTVGEFEKASGRRSRQGRFHAGSIAKKRRKHRHQQRHHDRRR